MANTKSTQHEIDLTGSLNLNKFKADIKPYEGFNERNAPYYGGCLSPLYIKDDGTQPSGVQFYNGHKYYIQNGTFYKDGTAIHSFSGTGSFTKTEWNPPNGNYSDIDFVDVCDNFAIGIRSKKIIVYDFVRSGIEEWDGTYINSRIFVRTDLNKRLAAIEWQDSNNDVKIRFIGFGAQAVNYDRSSSDFVKLYNDNRLEFSDDGDYVMYNSIVFDIRDLSDIRLVSFSCRYNRRVGDPDGDYISTSYNGVVIYSIHVEDGQTTSWSFHSLEEAYSTREAMFAITLICSANVFDVPTCFAVISDGASGDYKYLFHHSVDSVSVPTHSLGRISNSTVTLTASNVHYASKIDTGNVESCMPKISKTSYLPFFISTIRRPDSSAVHVASYITKYYEMLAEDGLAGAVKAWTVKDIDSYGYPIPAGGVFFFDIWGRFRLLASGTGQIQGISYSKDVSHIGTLLTSWGSVDGSKNIYIQSRNQINPRVIYFDSDSNKWTIITHYESTVPTQFTIIGDYAVFNTDAEINCININTGKKIHWASDWNNRINVQCNLNWRGTLNSLISSSYNVTNENPMLISSGQNVNWLNGHEISSAVFAPTITYRNIGLGGYLDWVVQGVGANTVDLNYVDVYKDYKYINTIVSNELDSTNGQVSTTSIQSSLTDTIYPSEVRYNIPLFFDVISSPYDLTIVRFGETGFLVMYYDTKIRYQYLASSIANFENVFIIQGQAYGITRNKIYSISYGNNTIQSIQPITTIEGLQYIGATIYNAYFYSPTARIIYSFGADNNLTVFSQADTFAEITGASYIPATGSILIGVNEVEGETETGCLYVLNERFGIYRINDIDGFKYASYLNDNSVGCITTENKLYRLKYEEDETFTKKDIILDTAFYGAGSNVVSVNDCWYIRVTDPEHNSGEIKLSVSTLTDIGRQTETRTFKIKATDWDELTDTVYIRFQPKLQRAVGVSLHVESPFKIGYIGVGATPETLQLNKGTI